MTEPTTADLLGHGIKKAQEILGHNKAANEHAAQAAVHTQAGRRGRAAVHHAGKWIRRAEMAVAAVEAVVALRDAGKTLVRDRRKGRH